MESPSAWVRIAVLIGVIAYLPTGILYFGAGLVAPEGLVPLFWAVWLAGVWAVAYLARRWSLWTLMAAPAVVLLWVIVVSTGELLFGWTA